MPHPAAIKELILHPRRHAVVSMRDPFGNASALSAKEESEDKTWLLLTY